MQCVGVHVAGFGVLWGREGCKWVALVLLKPLLLWSAGSGVRAFPGPQGW